MTPKTPTPTAEEFHAAAHEAFQFAVAYGFTEVLPRRRPDDPFQIWFERGDECIIVTGEGWGSAASVYLEHISGVELPVIDLVPPASRPPKPKHKLRCTTQLEQVRELASWLKVHGDDFLRGDLSRFISLARPLPPYKRSFTNAASQGGHVKSVIINDE